MRYLYNGVAVAGDQPLTINGIQHLRGPAGLTPDERAIFGITEVIEDERPTDEFAYVGEDPIRPGKWVVSPWPEERIKEALLSQAAAARWQREQRGFTIGALNILTDDRSKLMLMGARVLADADPTYKTQWAMPDGVVELGADQIIAISTAVAKFVDSCFTIYADVAADIAEGRITSSAEVREAFA